MNEKIYNEMISIIEDIFGISSIYLTEWSTFGDFSPTELEWWELEMEVEERLGAKVDPDIFCEPIFDVIVYIDYLTHEN